MIIERYTNYKKCWYYYVPYLGSLICGLKKQNVKLIDKYLFCIYYDTYTSVLFCMQGNIYKVSLWSILKFHTDSRGRFFCVKDTMYNRSQFSMAIKRHSSTVKKIIISTVRGVTPQKCEEAAEWRLSYLVHFYYFEMILNICITLSSIFLLRDTFRLASLSLLCTVSYSFIDRATWRNKNTKTNNELCDY